MFRSVGRMIRVPPRLVASRATLLGALLAAVLVLGGLLATEAWNAARYGAATARRALETHAAVAAWEFLRGFEAELDDAAGNALAPVVGVRAATPFDSLPGPHVLATSFAGILACPDADVARRLVRVDLRDGSAVLHGPALPAGDLRWVTDTLMVDAATFTAGRRDAVVFGSGPQERLALVYGVKFATFGAPLAAYAVVTCPQALGAPMFERVMARRALLPDAALARQPNDSVVAITVSDRHGHVLWRSSERQELPGDPATSYAAAASLSRVGAIRVEAALRAAAVERLAAEPVPRMRLGVLVALLVVTTGLATVALVQMRREQELARLRADFTSSVSHELRTPLAQIMLFGETLALDRFREAADRRLAAGTIVAEARRLMNMVDNILHFARAERGLATVAPQAEALAPLVRATVQSFAPLADGVRFREVVSDDVVALVDAGALRQVLLNLLDNAVKYGRPGQTVTVGVGVHGNGTAQRARLWVDDEGEGIAEADRRRVFAPYVRLARHQGAAHGGSGIGLSVVSELARLHGGEAWVEAAPTGGARFVVVLPLAPSASEADGADGGGSGGDAGAGAPPRHQHGDAATDERHHEPAARAVSAADVPPSGARA
jgi:signal transduction histidine kinase